MIKKIIKLGGLNVLSQAFYRLAVLLIYMVSTSSNTDSINDFAVHSTLITFLVIFQSLGVSGLSLAATTYISKFKEKENIYAKAIINISLFLALIISTIFFLSIDTLLEKVLKNIENISTNYKFLTFFIFILCINGVFKGFYYAKEEISYLAITSFLSAISLLISYFIFNFELLKSYLVSILFEFLFLILFSYNLFNIKDILQTKVFSSCYKELFRFIIPASASSMVLMPVNIIVIYILGLLSSVNSAVVVSMFNYGMQIRNLIIFIPSILGSFFLKWLSESNSKNNFFYMLLINFAVSVSISLGLISLKIMEVSYIDLISFSDLIILCLGSILFSINSVVGNKIVSLLKTKIGFYFNFIWAISFIFFTYVSVMINLVSPFLGILCAYIILTIIQFLYIKKYIFKRDTLK